MIAQEKKIVIKNFSFYYGGVQALREVTLDILSNEIFVIFGPARSGKTTLLKSLNRLTDLTFGRVTPEPSSWTGSTFMMPGSTSPN